MRDMPICGICGASDDVSRMPKEDGTVRDDGPLGTSRRVYSSIPDLSEVHPDHCAGREIGGTAHGMDREGTGDAGGGELMGGVGGVSLWGLRTGNPAAKRMLIFLIGCMTNIWRTREKDR